MRPSCNSVTSRFLGVEVRARARKTPHRVQPRHTQKTASLTLRICTATCTRLGIIKFKSLSSQYILLTRLKLELRASWSTSASVIAHSRSSPTLRVKHFYPPSTNAIYTMSGRGGGHQRKTVLLPPINLIFKHLTSNTTVLIWLYEQLEIRIEGQIKVQQASHLKITIHVIDRRI